MTRRGKLALRNVSGKERLYWPNAKVSCVTYNYRGFNAENEEWDYNAAFASGGVSFTWYRYTMSDAGRVSFHLHDEMRSAGKMKPNVRVRFTRRPERRLPPHPTTEGEFHMKTKLVLSVIFLSIIAGRNTMAQTMPPTLTQHKYGILNYDFFVPSPDDSAKEYPLIIYLHGYNDTTEKYFNWYESSAQAAHPCFVLAPKCPPSDAGGWGNSFLNLFSNRLRLTFDLMDSLTTVYNIDTNRLYIYGTSMGGYGTFEALSTFPGRFAAAMVLCGGGNPNTAHFVMMTPLWIFHGGLDNVVPISQSLDLYNEMIAIGAKRVRFTEYPSAGHDMWNYAPKEPAWPDWIFNFTRGETFTERPDIPIHVSCTTKPIKFPEAIITWNNVDEHDVKRNNVWYYKVFRDDTLIGTPNFTDTTLQDVDLHSGRNIYKVVAVNYDFMSSDTSNADTLDVSTGIEQYGKPVPNEFRLSQNFPNPFNPSTAIRYQLSAVSHVTLRVYDVLGRAVATLVNGVKQPGSYEVSFDGSGLPSGVYFCKLDAGGYHQTRKLLLLK